MTAERVSQLRVGLVGLLLLVGGIIYLLLPFSALRWAQSPFLGFFIDPNLVINDSGEPDWPSQGDEALVGYPDRITAVDNQPISTIDDYLAVVANKAPGDLVELTLTQPPAGSRVESGHPDAERTVTLPVIPFTTLALWNQFGLFYLTGFLLLVIGTWTFIVRPKREAAQVFALFMGFAALAVGSLFNMLTLHQFDRVWLLALSFTPGFCIWLTAVFPHEMSFVDKYPRGRWFTLLPGLAAGLWAQLWLYDSADPWQYAIPWRTLFLLNGLAIVISLLMMAYRGFRSPSPLVRQQARIVLGGSLLAFTPLVLFFIPASQMVDVAWLPSAFYLPPLVIYPLAIAYTIVRYRLLDFDLVLRRSLSYGAMTGFLLLAFLLLTVGLTNTFGAVTENPVLLSVLVVTMVLLFNPLRSRLQEAIDQLFFAKPVALDKLLRGYNRELTTAVNTDQVAKNLLKYVASGVPDSTPHLFLPDAQMNYYSSYENGASERLNAESPLVAYMRETTAPIDLTETRAWPQPFSEQSAEIHALNAAVLVPINNGRELLGWLSLSPKQNRDHFRQAEINYISALVDQSLIGLERANVIRRLETRVSELDMLSNFSQALNFTIDFDALLELVFINFQRLLGINDFFISLRDKATKQIYTAFYLENGERYEEKEGSESVVTDPAIHQVMGMGQIVVKEDEHGRSWLAAPLNAGADTIGAIHTFYRDPTHKIRARQQQLFSVFADRTAAALERIDTKEKLQERAEQLEIMNKVTFSLSSIKELDALLELILDTAMELLDTEAGTFMISREEDGELEFKVARGPSSHGLIGRRLPLGAGLAGTAAQTGRPILVNRVKDDDRWFSDVDADSNFSSESILTVPLVRHNTVLGVVQVINKKSKAEFNKEDQSLLMAFGGQAVVAMENARLLAQTDEKLQKSVDELFLLQQLDRDLSTTLNLENVLNITLDRMLGIYQGIAGAIVLVDEEGEMTRKVTRGYEGQQNELSDKKKLSAKSGLIGHVIQSKKPHYAHNVIDDDNYIIGNNSTLSQMTLPFINKQELIGVIAIESDKIDNYSEDDLQTAVRITNHAAAAIANAILYEKVNEANQAKSEFVSMVSHELKTPMTSLRGYTDLLLSGMTGDLTEQQHNFLETMSANIRRMSQQIQDLTDISRIETGQLHIELAPTSFVNVMNETMQTVKGMCDEKGIRIHLELPEELPLIMADKGRMVQVLTNLLSNACKYSPPNTDVWLRFMTRMIPNEETGKMQPMVCCCVKDSGYGISPEDQEKLFTKFFRSDDANIRQAKGTGLGLSITKGIIELHGGEIWVESKLGEGTSFQFSIPQDTVQT
ncbi:GAF domain-containing protein [Candidatus Leptofilum sp.]|uniref:GAF domain-containing protein n=1 Tax=Candidatus Leptofilum sp. TaxID=3241576 RepID=UPI003B5C4FB6